MPNKDGKGPAGAGPKTGKGRGLGKGKGNRLGNGHGTRKASTQKSDANEKSG